MMTWRNRLSRKEHHDDRHARRAANRADRESLRMSDFRNLSEAALQFIRGDKA